MVACSSGGLVNTPSLICLVGGLSTLSTILHHIFLRSSEPMNQSERVILISLDAENSVLRVKQQLSRREIRFTFDAGELALGLSPPRLVPRPLMTLVLYGNESSMSLTTLLYAQKNLKSSLGGDVSKWSQRGGFFHRPQGVVVALFERRIERLLRYECFTPPMPLMPPARALPLAKRTLCYYPSMLAFVCTLAPGLKPDDIFKGFD